MKHFIVTKNGKPLNPYLYHWDGEDKTFITDENNLVLDFRGWEGVTFKTGSYCAFTAGTNCTFNTGSDCIFKTGPNCTFNTGSDCTFNTGYSCIFNTDYNCIFDTGHSCVFKNGPNCTFDASFDCTFNTGDNCVIIRRDVFEIIKPEPNATIKLNGAHVPGYKIVNNKHKIVIDGEEITISKESYQALKDCLL